MQQKIAHLTSVHPRYDIRIFRKQCKTLARAGYAVNLIVADGKGDEDIDGVAILDAGAPRQGRLGRMAVATRMVLQRARDLQAVLYHIHDPELLPVGLKLKRDGFKVVFDSHEDYSSDILTKPYLNPGLLRLISKSYNFYERYSCRKLDFVISATPKIRENFEKMGCRSLDISNFPLLEEFGDEADWMQERRSVCYIGAMNNIRGLPQIVDAVAETNENIALHLAGEFTESAAENKCRLSRGWGRVVNHGYVGRGQIRKILDTSFAGLVTLLPSPNHLEAQPIKMFEYMSAGIPVIGSNFPLYRSIIEENQCGFCVDPENVAEIARVINTLFEDQVLAREMGRRGREAVLSRYNWETEGEKLVSLYKLIVGG